MYNVDHLTVFGRDRISTFVPHEVSDEVRKSTISKPSGKVDLGIPPGFDLLSEDLQTLVEKTAGQKSVRLEKFSLTQVYYSASLTLRCEYEEDEQK